MKVVTIENAQEGMRVAKSIYGVSGEILLRKDVILNDRYIKRLRELGITAVYISDEAIGEIEINEPVSEKTRVQALHRVREFVGSLKVTSQVNLTQVNEIIENILDEMLTNEELMIRFVEIRSLDDNIYGHSVNVAILSIITGISMGYNYDALKKLTLGALFHDIGMTLIPDNIKNKGDALTLEERAILNSHPQLGFDVLRKIHSFSLVAAHVALEHHERYQGNGFPRRLKGEEISEFARIVMIANLYDRLTTKGGGSVYCQPFQAIELIMANSGIFFDPAIVKVFIKNIAIFPIGTQVALNTGEVGIVVEVNKEHPTRPIVRLLFNSEGERISPSYDVDLADNPNYCVIRIVEEG